MSELPIVSVIVPAFNAERTIGERIRIITGLGMTETAFYLADPAQRPALAAPLSGRRRRGARPTA